jgi:putative ABC transport system permease protein
MRYAIVGTMPPVLRSVPPHRRMAAASQLANRLVGRRGAGPPRTVAVAGAAARRRDERVGHRRRPALALDAVRRRVPQTATALRVLAGAVALLLLIAIGNAANVLLADAVRRDAEMTLRSSLGASRWRLARQIVAEVLIRSMAAAAVAAALAMGTLAFLSTSVPQVIAFRALRPIALDWRALLFGVAIDAAAGLLAGMTSMARAAGSTHLDTRLRAFGWQTRDHGRIRNALLVTQLALTVAVLAGAGLLGHAFVKLSRVDYGFDPEHLVSFSLKLPARTAAGRGVQSTLDQLRAEASRVPDVAAATISDSLPPRMNVGAAGGLETLDRGRSTRRRRCRSPWLTRRSSRRSAFS